MIDGADEKAREDFDHQLLKPPPSASKEEIRRLPQWEEGAAGADFLAQLQARGGASRTTSIGTKGVVA